MPALTLFSPTRSRVSVLLIGVALVLSLSVVPPATAQSELATVFGRVTDPSGAVVPGVEVEIKNVETNVETIQTTNSDGLYTVPSLRPGHYVISARKQGFKTVTVTGLTLNIQDNLVRNFQLQVGSFSESMTVTADQNNINTSDASVSTVVDQTYIKNMPLNGRSFQDLILLTPGIVTQTTQPSAVFSGLGSSGEFSVNGQRTESNYYTVDGVSANTGASTGLAMMQGAGASGSLGASTALGTTQTLVSVDDLQEFRVQSSTYSAEYGRNPGGQFAFQTKSGTNEWHGSAFDYLRNNFFDANDWFNDYFGKTEPPLRQNDFGGTFGGPVRIPKLYNGKDKTFFFASYEGLRLTAPQPAAVSYVPDAALRVSAPAPLNQLLNAFPVQSPNAIDDTANGIAQFVGSWSNPSSIDSASVRLDHALTDKLRLFFRFSSTSSRSSSRASVSPTTNQTLSYDSKTYTVGVSSFITTHFSSDFRLNYSLNDATSNDAVISYGGNTPVNPVQLANLPAGSAVELLISYHGYFPFLGQVPTSGAQKQWNLVETIHRSFGRHELKAGIDYRRLTPSATEPPSSVLYVYPSEPAIQANSSLDFLATQAPIYPLYANFSAFADDQWKLSRRLNLSLGLRWEVNPAPSVTRGLHPYTLQGTGPADWVLAPQGTRLWRTTWANFAPRLGVAYDAHTTPGWETVVRGGFGVFFDTGQQLGSLSFEGPGFSATTIQFGKFPGALSFPLILNPPLGNFSAVYGFSPDLRLPYTLQWNASVEQALGKSQAFGISYVGSHASRLLQLNEYNSSTNPLSNNFFVVQNGLPSDYQSMQLHFRRNLTQGLTGLASYTLSHCIDYGSFNYSIGYQRGNCDFDVRHNFTAAFSYSLPTVGRGWVGAVLHEWGIDSRFTGRTGFPVALSGAPTIDPATGHQISTGLDFVSGQPVYLYGASCQQVLGPASDGGIGDLSQGKGCPGGRAINPCAFALPGQSQMQSCLAAGLVGTVGGLVPRNFARGFGAWQMDLAVRRDFPIYENLKLQFRAEAFNIFNHPNFGTIDTGFGDTAFGQATATLASSLGVVNPLYQMGGPRSMQLALKLVF